MVGGSRRAAPDDDYDDLATQWFIVSDLGLTAFSGNDGIHVFVHSLASDAAEGGGRSAADRRATTRCWRPSAPTRTAMCSSKPALTRGEGGLSPALLVATDPKGDYAFLNLKAPAFDLSRPRRRRPRRCRPGSMRSSIPSAASTAPARPCMSPRCCATAQGVAALGVPLTLVVERPDGVEYRRAVVADQGVGGRSARVAAGRRRRRPAPGACAPTPIRSVRRSARRPSWSRTTCRIASSSISPRPPRRISQDSAGRGHASTAASSTARRPPTSSSKAR